MATDTIIKSGHAESIVPETYLEDKEINSTWSELARDFGLADKPEIVQQMAKLFSKEIDPQGFSFDENGAQFSDEKVKRSFSGYIGQEAKLWPYSQKKDNLQQFAFSILDEVVEEYAADLREDRASIREEIRDLLNELQKRQIGYYKEQIQPAVFKIKLLDYLNRKKKQAEAKRSSKETEYIEIPSDQVDEVVESMDFGLEKASMIQEFIQSMANQYSLEFIEHEGLVEQLQESSNHEEFKRISEELRKKFELDKQHLQEYKDFVIDEITERAQAVRLRLKEDYVRERMNEAAKSGSLEKRKEAIDRIKHRLEAVVLEQELEETRQHQELPKNILDFNSLEEALPGAHAVLGDVSRYHLSQGLTLKQTKRLLGEGVFTLRFKGLTLGEVIERLNPTFLRERGLL